MKHVKLFEGFIESLGGIPIGEIIDSVLSEKSFSIDTLSASDSDKITDALDKDDIGYDKNGSVITIKLDRAEPKASVILNHLEKIAKFEEVNEAEKIDVEMQKIIDKESIAGNKHTYRYKVLKGNNIVLKELDGAPVEVLCTCDAAEDCMSIAKEITNNLKNLNK